MVILTIHSILETLIRKEVSGMARGLGSANMDPAKKRRIQSEGGKSSHGGGRPRGPKNDHAP